MARSACLDRHSALKEQKVNARVKDDPSSTFRCDGLIRYRRHVVFVSRPDGEARIKCVRSRLSRRGGRYRVVVTPKRVIEVAAVLPRNPGGDWSPRVAAIEHQVGAAAGFHLAVRAVLPDR